MANSQVYLVTVKTNPTDILAVTKNQNQAISACKTIWNLIYQKHNLPYECDLSKFHIEPVKYNYINIAGLINLSL